MHKKNSTLEEQHQVLRQDREMLKTKLETLKQQQSSQ